MSLETYVSFSFPLGPGVPKSNTASIGIHRLVLLGKRFGDALFDFERAYMWLAISMLRFI